MLAKGHIQPHHNNVPRRRQRTQYTPSASSIPHPKQKARLLTPRRSIRGSTDSTGSKASASTIDRGEGERPSPGTPLTCPSGEILLADTLLDTNKPHPSSPQPHSGNAQRATPDDDLTSPIGILPPPPPIPSKAASKVNNVSSESAPPPRPTDGGAHGHLEPRVTNVPRRLSCAHKERSRVRRRCLQELIAGSGVWMAFDLRSSERVDHDNEDEVSVEEPTIEEKREWHWMWEERFEFSGVLRVRVGLNHGAKVTRRNEEGEKEEMELVIEKEKVMMYDDSGMSALTDSQLEAAAHFLINCRRKRQGSMGKVLIMAPPSRPVEAISIALFTLSLPSTSVAITAHDNNSSDITERHSTSYLSEIRFLPGILGLGSREINVADDDDHHDTQLLGDNSKSTLIQLALWHLHDLPMPAISDFNDDGGLKAEWRGALSLDGIKRLENLVVSQQ